MYSNVYGFSCIENQVLAILSQRKQKIELTYYDCAIPVHELYPIMVVDGIKPEYFNYIPRVQDILRELGVISFTMIDPASVDDLIKSTQLCKENEYILIRVKPDFTTKILHARGFRSDHYVLLKSSESGFDIYNDIPECIVNVDKNGLSDAYAGSYIKMKVLRELDLCDADKLWASRLYRPETQTIADYGNHTIENIENIGIKLRNLTGVNKTLKRRMAQYYGIYTDTSFIHQKLPEIDKPYAMAEYYVLKKNSTAEKWQSILNDLYSIDTEIFTQLKSKLGGINYA
ncbi:MAG: hypothetical protein HFE63_08015 [Clostridiales bacterium]|nr:hypothetical protein [Clostridiales bacterium]